MAFIGRPIFTKCSTNATATTRAKAAHPTDGGTTRADAQKPGGGVEAESGGRGAAKASTAAAANGDNQQQFGRANDASCASTTNLGATSQGLNYLKKKKKIRIKNGKLKFKKFGFLKWKVKVFLKNG